MRSDSWQIEKDFVPRTLEEAVDLQRAIEAAGYSSKEALSIPQWAIRKAAGEDTVSAPTRARYRKVLASLNGHYPVPPRRRRKSDVTPPYVTSPRPETPELEEAA